MKRHTLLIELKEDCVFSASAATEGAHESMDRIPGSALLGAAASQTYSTLSSEDAWLIYHSGKVRFNDGLPWNGHGTAYPVPYSWHHEKSLSPDENGYFIADHVFNFGSADKQEITTTDGKQKQAKQLRAGYVHTDGQWSKPLHGLRLKTAVDSRTGRAAEGQLFGYDALERNQHFVADIEADDDVDETLFQKVVDTLLGEGFLGRSRSAEYGRVQIKSIQRESLKPGSTDAQRMQLWTLSDLALNDVNGLPTLTPDGESIGLPGARFDAGRSFMRYRRYSPWNAARRGYDNERLVLTAGSVLSFLLDEAPGEEVINQLQRGIGLHREAGLGKIWVNPPSLVGTHPEFTNRAVQQNSTFIQRPDHPLIDWLLSHDDSWKQRADEHAQSLAEDYRQVIARARNAGGIDKNAQFGPSKSQWGNILDAARGREGADLFDNLFQGESAIIKVTAAGWNIDVPPTVNSEEWSKLADWMKSKLKEDNPVQREYAHRIRRLAHRVRLDIDKRRV